ncbi:MAG: ribosome biogenesis GTPase YlqF [Lachnospiraceae bacterium]
MHYQWYPGHMSKARRQMQEDIKLVDVVLELLDARIPFSSKNPDIDELAKGKARVILLNKADLADDKITVRFQKFYEQKGCFVCCVNSKGGTGVKKVMDVVRAACREKIERDRARGMINRPIRAMIVGIPNVGKSTFINSFAGKACAKTGNKPGVTKGKQWIRLNKELELLDTPGILWPKFEDQRVGLHLAMIGSINEDILDQNEMAIKLLEYCTKTYPGAVTGRYQVEECESGSELLSRIAEKRACKKKGGELDLEKMAGSVVDDFRGGRLGRISLETPEEKNS